MAWWWPFGRTKKRSLAEGAEIAEKKLFSVFSSALSALSALKSPAASPTKALGNRGETFACRCLKKAGMKILARNYRCPGGEIDIIALDPSTRRTSQAETIVFVEVKTRAAETPAGPQSAIDAHKRNQVAQAARYYLRHYPAKGYLTRYDVVAVIAPPGQKPTVRHIPNAF